MILVDAVYINNGGGKILLDYFITSILSSCKEDVYFLLDKRYEEYSVLKKEEQVTYINGSIIKRHQFYLKHRNAFNKIFCFGNLPPTVRLSSIVYTYFHQYLFIDMPESLPLIDKTIISLKSLFLSLIKKNTDYWIVQSGRVKSGLSKKLNIKQDIILNLPFFQPMKMNKSMQFIERKVESFLYVSNAPLYKNHDLLLDAFCAFYDKRQRGELHITVGPTFEKLIEKIEHLKSKKYPITNHGFVNRNKLNELYLSNEFCFYPSLTESFGLGLIEAIEGGCKLIAADRPYTHVLCKPSGLFNPLDMFDMVRAFEHAIDHNLSLPHLKVSNKIKELLMHLEK